MAHHGVGVGHDKGHTGHYGHRLAQHIGGGGIVGAGVVGIQSQHAAGQLIHQIVGRGLEHHVLVEARGQLARLLQQGAELVVLGLIGQRAHQKQIHHFLIAEGAGFQVGLHNVRGIDAPVIQLAGHGHSLAVDNGVALHAAHAGDAYNNAGAVGISQPPLHVHMGVLTFVNGVGALNIRVQFFQIFAEVYVG